MEGGREGGSEERGKRFISICEYRSTDLLVRNSRAHFRNEGIISLTLISPPSFQIILHPALCVFLLPLGIPRVIMDWPHNTFFRG